MSPEEVFEALVRIEDMVIRLSVRPEHVQGLNDFLSNIHCLLTDAIEHVRKSDQ